MMSNCLVFNTVLGFLSNKSAQGVRKVLINAGTENSLFPPESLSLTHTPPFHPFTPTGAATEGSQE